MRIQHFAIISIACIMLNACSKSTKDNTAPPPPDPGGTNSRNISLPGYTVLCEINTSLVYPALGGAPIGVYPTGLWLNVDAGRNFWLSNPSGGGPATYSITGVGAVSGLGAITSYPTSGYSNSTAAVKGNGYVIKTLDYDPVTYQLYRIQYYRVYIEAYQVSTSGGIIGVSIKYQGPY